MGTPRAASAGQLFGRLTLKEYVGGGRWLCDCACGGQTTVHLSDLRRTTKSCGCLRREKAAENGRRSVTHGMSKSPEYDVWERMHHRCNNSADKAYHNYGGRGISVCRRWKSFASFLADMGPRPSAKHTLERENNNGNYEPSNCLWVTRKVQARNRRSNRMLSLDGKTMCVSAWSEETGISRQAIYDRLKSGWSVRQALSTPMGAPKVTDG